MKVRFWFEHGYNETEVEVFDFPEGTTTQEIEREHENWFYEQCGIWGIEGGYDIEE